MMKISLIKSRKEIKLPKIISKAQMSLKFKSMTFMKVRWFPKSTLIWSTSIKWNIQTESWKKVHKGTQNHQTFSMINNLYRHVIPHNRYQWIVQVIQIMRENHHTTWDFKSKKMKINNSFSQSFKVLLFWRKKIPDKIFCKAQLKKKMKEWKWQKLPKVNWQK